MATLVESAAGTSSRIFFSQQAAPSFYFLKLAPLLALASQVMLIPVHADWNAYCDDVRSKLHNAGFYADVDLSKNTFQKKVRNAQVAQYNYQLVVGEAEVKNGTVNIRTRENVVEGEMKVEDMIAMLSKLRDDYK